MKPASHTSPQVTRQPQLPTPLASARIYNTQQMLTRPSNSTTNNRFFTGQSNCANSHHFTGPSNCATNRQQQTPLLTSPPHYHIVPRLIIARAYQQQYPQVTHRPVIILILTDQFMNLLAHQAKNSPIQQLIATIIITRTPAKDEDTDEMKTLIKL